MYQSIRTLLLGITLLFSFAGYAQDPVQAKKDDEMLQAYFKTNKIKATKTASGLYYVIHKKGTGSNAQAGQKVSMKYLGKFLDGKKFDGNMDEQYNLTRGYPLEFDLGRGMVIAGWDEGVQLLNPGTRATFYLPSGIAYGPGGRGPIPPNSILVFDVELIGVK